MSPSVLIVIPPQQFRDEELLVPKAAFLKAGWQVDIASTQIGKCTGMLGASQLVSYTLEDITPEDYDAVVVVGGMGSPAYLWQSTRLHQVLQVANQHERVVAAICLSGVVLALAGLLQGKKATVWESPESLIALEQGGATYTRLPLEIDDRIITANGPDAADEFAAAIISRVTELQAASRQ